ncbi:MAG: histone deacetylase family protein [Myxococcales bacterium]|nr:histone deacetylase family protein [Myxococcales bacterium]
MFRIRRVHEAQLAGNRSAVEQVQAMLREVFPLARAKEIDELPGQLVNALGKGFQTLLYVAERRHQVIGVALLLHEPEIGFLYLDYLSAAPGRTGRGLGDALYRATRETARRLGVKAILMECLPDDPALCKDAEQRRQNAARLKFYERYGARPVAGTAYETPLDDSDDAPPYLVCDPLGGRVRRALAQAAVRAILERKYAWLCTPAYNEAVVASFTHDPIALRAPRYTPADERPPAPEPGEAADQVLVIANDRHDIHHIRERGYVESPARLRSILKALRRSPSFEEAEPRRHPDAAVLAVHDPEYVRYFRKVCEGLGPDEPVYPYVFPVRNAARPPKELSVRAGYYCVDTFTPLTRNAYLAARRAVDCALTCADALLDGRRVAYALVRPPGHHAERRHFGGFCYFNNAAIAAHALSAHGKVAILDVDYHHGNGQQDIFYQRDDVLTVSIHGDPSFAYPYFSGFADETGEGLGEGFNLNLPLPEELDGAGYQEALTRALARVRAHGAQFLVVALGLDTALGDPTGTWRLSPEDFERNGRVIGALGIPTLVVQEGGYTVRRVGTNAARFLGGLRTALR